MTYVDFHLAMLQLAAVARFRETSVHRSPVSNQKVGGKHDSYHQIRMASDIVPEARSEADKIKMFGPKLGLQVIDEGDHLHIEPGG